MNPTGKTQPFAVLGHPIAHSLSPPLHNAAFEALGWDAIYCAYDVHPDRLLEVLHAMRHMGFRGANLTVPLKEVAFRGIPDLDESSRLVSAVNTVKMTEDGLRGFNTDGYGFLTDLRESCNQEVAGRKVTVLGSGGSARALALVCAGEGAASVTVVARNRERTDALVRELEQAAPSVQVRGVCDADAQEAAVRDGELVIQATPVGLKADDPPLFPASAFRAGQVVYDLNYTFPVTSTLRSARDAGAAISNGLGMLLYQGVRSFEIWTDTTPPVDAMRQALQKAIA